MIIPKTFAIGSNIAKIGFSIGIRALSKDIIGGNKASTSCIIGGSNGMMTLLTI